METKKANSNLSKYYTAIEKAKQELKYAEKFLFIIDKWNDRSRYDFTSIAGGYVSLFGNYGGGDYSSKKFFSCGDIDLRAFSIQHYIEMHLMRYDENHKDHSELVKLKRYIKEMDKLKEDNPHFYWKLITEFENLIGL